MTWLARHYSPEDVIEVGVAPRREPSLLLGRVQAGLRRDRSRTPGPNWVADERAFQQTEPRSHPEVSADAVSRHHEAGARARSRAPTTTPSASRSYAAFNYPGVVAHVGCDRRRRTARSATIVDDQGPGDLHGDVARVGPGTRTLFYTTDNDAHRDLIAARSPTLDGRNLLQKDARIGDLAFNHADKSLWGIRHLNGFCTLVRIPSPYTQWEQRHLLALRHRRVRPRRVAGRRGSSRRRSARSRGSRTSACSRRRR